MKFHFIQCVCYSAEGLCKLGIFSNGDDIVGERIGKNRKER